MAWARGWQRAGPTWPVSAGGIGRQARGLLAAGQEARGRGVSPGPLSGARMGATPLLAAPGRITSPLLAPLQNGHGRSELQGLARVTGRSLCRVGTARGAVRARGLRPAHLHCGEQLCSQVSRVPGSMASAWAARQATEKLRRLRSLPQDFHVPGLGRGRARWEESNCCPGEPDGQPG